MFKKFLPVISVMMILAFVMAACAPAAPATEAPKPEAQKVEITVWHSYHTGGQEEAAFTQLLEKFTAANPNIKVNALSVPFDQLFKKWDTEVAAGGGPDLFTAPNDSLGRQSRDGTVAAIDDLVAGKLGKYSPAGVEGMKVDGKIYGVPGIIKAVGLFYNKTNVPTPPATADDLLKMVKEGKKIAIILGGGAAYFNFGWYPTFGGLPFDESGKCVADTAGVADSLQYLLDLKAAGGTFETDGGKAATMFKQGEVDMIVDGPWMLGDYEKALGDKLGVAPIPAGPKSAAKPIFGIDGWYVNPNSKQKEAAITFALYMFGPEGLPVYADVAGSPVVMSEVKAKDPLITEFFKVAEAGFARPQGKWFDNYWGPFGDMFTAVMEGKVTPQEGIAKACADMNKANGK